MKQSFRELNLGASGVAWAEERLRGTSYLAKEAYDNLRAGDCHAVVSWPRDLNVESAYEFDVGGKFGRSGKSDFAPSSWLATELQQYILRSNSYAVLQELYIEADLRIPAGPLEAYRCESNYAQFVCDNAADVEDFLRSLSLGGIGQHFIIGVLIGPLGRCPGGITAIFLPVYDGEAFMRITFGRRAATKN
jgi:hypothetical protein